MTTFEEVTIGAFSQPLVAMSFIISVLGSWVGLTCANRARRRRDSESWLWLFGAALSIGGGAIWSMHFIGMLAFDSHITYALNVGTTIISLVAAIVAAMVGMLIATAMKGNSTGFILGGVVTGGGVCAMHYIGMYAMDMNATMSWKPALVVASVVIALAASSLALYFAFNVTTRLKRVAASVIMGIGVCAMHYVGMLALEIHSSDTAVLGHVSGADPVYLAMPIFAISAGLLIVIGFGTMFAGIDDELDEAWVKGQSELSTSTAMPLAAERPPSGEYPIQPLPSREPAASGAAAPGDGNLNSMFAQRQRPTQLRPQNEPAGSPQNGRWSPRPYAQQGASNFPARRAERFNAFETKPVGAEPEATDPAAAPVQAPTPRTPGWLPPRDQNM